MAPDWRRKIFKTHAQQDGDGPDELYQPSSAPFAEESVLDYSTVDLFGDDTDDRGREVRSPAQQRMTAVYGHEETAEPVAYPAEPFEHDDGSGEGGPWGSMECRPRAQPGHSFEVEAATPAVPAPEVPHLEADTRATELEPQPAPAYNAWVPPAAEPAAPQRYEPEPTVDYSPGPLLESLADLQKRAAETTRLQAPPVAPAAPAALPEPQQSVVKPQIERKAATMNEDTRLAEEISRRLGMLASQLGELAGAVMELERRQREREQSVQAVVAQISALSTQLHTAMPSLTDAPPAGSTQWSSHAA